MAIHGKYLLKNTLYTVMPGGFGYYRQLRKLHNPNYNHERDKHPVRVRHNRLSGWSQVKAPIFRRDYANYEEYTVHQAQKFSEILLMYGGFPHLAIVSWRRRFFARFKHLLPLLPKDAVILCLGARQGTEVEVLRDLGFKNAYGIDLNPGPDNPFVVLGDFMHLAEADQSIDCIYTNCVDHAFDLVPFLAEQRRVLKPTGLAIYDLPRYSGTRSPGAFEAIGWSSEKDIMSYLQRSFQKVILSRLEKKWHWILLQTPKRMK